jgi:diketogulonate reductase-like aldo/keto reductase
VPDDMSPQPRPSNEQFLDLPGGYKMPQNGIGMCCRPSAYDDELVYRTVLWYLLLGGRHIDGAHLYLNHEAIGKGIAEAMHRGVKREEIFVTTKIFPSHFGYQSTLSNVKKYVKELGLEYIDLVLLHFPSSFPLQTSPCKKDGKDSSQCRRETWAALSELREAGLIRNAGVSNFALKHLKDLEGLGAPIANNQIQFTPFEPEYVMETVQYCFENNITVTAYSPLGGLVDQNKAMVDDVLNKIASKYGKRVADIMLRWAMQRGFAVIPGTGNPQHMKQNLAIFDFELADEDMSVINDLKHNAKGFMHIDVRKTD